jgi:hypothetical protein
MARHDRIEIGKEPAGLVQIDKDKFHYNNEEYQLVYNSGIKLYYICKGYLLEEDIIKNFLKNRKEKKLKGYRVRNNLTGEFMKLYKGKVFFLSELAARKSFTNHMQYPEYNRDWTYEHTLSLIEGGIISVVPVDGEV